MALKAGVLYGLRLALFLGEENLATDWEPSSWQVHNSFMQDDADTE